MAGQFPQGSFDVTKLKVTKEHDPFPELDMNIIDFGEKFDLTVNFEGKGLGWRMVCEDKVPFVVRFYAEGIGEAPDLNLGEATGNLVPGKFTYEITQTINGIDKDVVDYDAVFKLAASVTFPQRYGLLGFCDGPMIHVSQWENPG